MVDQDSFDEEITASRELERALSALRPAPSRIDRDRFLYLAGRASAETERRGPFIGRWAWPAATLVSGATAVLLALLLATRPETVGRQSVSIAPANSNALSTAIVADSPIAAAGPQDSRAEMGAAITVPSASELPATELMAELDSTRFGSLKFTHGIDPRPAPTRGVPAVPDPSGREEPQSERQLLRQFLNADETGKPTSADRAG